MRAPSPRSDPAPAAEAAPGGDRRDRGADDDGPKVSGVQVLGSVLASVSGATVASLFGVAGTVLGAAVVSVISVVGSALYVRGLRRTHRRLRELELQQRLLVRLPGEPQRRAARTAVHPRHGDGAHGGGDGPDEAGGGRVRALWARLGEVRWRPAVALAVVLVASLGSITLIEAVRDEPLSGRSDGARTSIGALLGDGGDGPDTDGPPGTDGTVPGEDGDRPTRGTTTTAPGSGSGDPAGGSGTGDAPDAGDDPRAPVARAPGGSSTTAPPTTAEGTSPTTTTEGGADGGGATEGSGGAALGGAGGGGDGPDGAAGSAAPADGTSGSPAPGTGDAAGTATS